MASKSYSAELAGIVNEFLNEDDWKFSFDSDNGLFNFGLNLKGKIKNIKYIVDIKDDQIIVYGISPIGADADDPKVISEMAQFLSRANYGLRNGCFELDVTDGEIRFRSFIDCDEQKPSKAVIKNSIYITASMFERYSKGIVGIVFSDMTNKEAIDICENN